MSSNATAPVAVAMKSSSLWARATSQPRSVSASAAASNAAECRASTAISSARTRHVSPAETACGGRPSSRRRAAQLATKEPSSAYARKRFTADRALGDAFRLHFRRVGRRPSSSSETIRSSEARHCDDLKFCVSMNSLSAEVIRETLH